MNRIFSYIIYISLAAVAGFAFAACEDDVIAIPGEPGEGIAPIEVTIGFMPMAEADNNTGGSRAAAPGDGMNELTADDVCLLFYDREKNLVATYSMADFVNFGVSNPDRTDNDVPQEPGSSGVSAEKNTRQATFSIKDVPFGRYYIYAVANLGRYKGGTKTTTLQELQTEEYAKAIKTVDGLRSIKLEWDATNFRNNRQMLGYLTPEGSDIDKPTMSLDAPLITLDGVNTRLHSWLKRAASKVTVTFNGAGLRENVRVYIKNAVLRDIPANCMLGKDNTVIDEDGMTDDSTHELTFGEGSDYTKWPSITRGNPKLDEKVWNHNPESKALFFFENRQGDFTNAPDRDRYDKRQWPADDGSVMDKADKKDNVPYGTYIEVEGYYVSRAGDNVTNGKIIYRFMLGQDVYYNFDATRNCHYMLTLNFRGNANDVDWHIEYNEDYPQIYMPEKYYISYLYNREMYMPVRVNVGSSFELTDLRAEILCNNWAPSTTVAVSAPSGTGSYKFTWNKPYYDSHKKAKDPYINNLDANWVEESNNFDRDEYNTDLEAGFLSLRQTKGSGKEILSEVTGSDNYAGKLKEYWETHNRGWREYKFPSSPSSQTYDGDSGDGSYTVVRNDSTFTFDIPFYTRAKQMSAWLAYTANNPYPYPRHAVVRVTATFLDKLTGKTLKRSKRVVIEQVERVQNPKGIWRDWDETASFDVELLKRDPNDFSKFVNIESDGPWRAEVAAGADWIKLNGKLNHIVQGSTGTEIKFTYEPDGPCASNTAEDVRSGVIRVYYNNYTCVHLIFVRQGYASQAIFDNGSKWCVFNLYSKVALAKSPMSAGSYFRCGNLNQAILEENNDNTTFGFGKAIGGTSGLAIRNASGNKTTTYWNNIGCYRSQAYDANSPLIYTKANTRNNVTLGNNMFDDLTIGGKRYHVAEYDDFHKLMTDAEHGYGVLYCGGATGVQKTTAGAFEFKDFDNSGAVNTAKGMRGIFTYNPADGRQIFFPITAVGHGRRKSWISEGSNNGVLRYGDVKDPIKEPRVMVYDLNQTPGAMYWLRAGRKDGHVEGGATFNSFSWDMNYYTFGFGTYHRFVFYPGSRGSDALLIKLIEE